MSPLEASHDHLLVTPPSHFTLQKAKGQVNGFTRLRRNGDWLKGTLMRMNSQEENCLLQLLLFLQPKSMISI